MTADRILRDIEAAQEKIEATKKEVASRWNKVAGVSPVDRSRLSSQESTTRVREIIDDVIVKLNDAYDHAQELYQEIEDAKVFYPGKMQFLMNATIMSESRAKYAAALALAGPMELAGYASYAIGVQDHVLAAATIQANDALSSKDRRFSSVAVANRIEIPAGILSNQPSSWLMCYPSRSRWLCAPSNPANRVLLIPSALPCLRTT